MKEEEFKRMMLEALRDDPKFRRAVNIAVASHALEKVAEYYVKGSAQDIIDLREQVINEALGIETVVEIDTSLKWEPANNGSLSWGLYNHDVNAMNFIAKVARVSTGITSNYFMKSLRKDLDYTKEVKRIEEALRHLNVSQFIEKEYSNG